MGCGGQQPGVPGTPDFVLGGRVPTLLISLSLALLVVSAPALLRRAGRLPPPDRAALVGGVSYGLGTAAVWLGMLLVFAPRLLPDPSPFLLLLPAAVALHAAVPWYAYARWRLRLPLAGLFVAATLAGMFVLGIGGETDGYALYAVFTLQIVPGLCLLAGVELGARALWARR
jgi:hypothetical protein